MFKISANTNMSNGSCMLQYPVTVTDWNEECIYLIKAGQNGRKYIFYLIKDTLYCDTEYEQKSSHCFTSIMPISEFKRRATVFSDLALFQQN